MPPYAVRFDRAASHRVASLGLRDRETIAENIAAVRANPRCFGSHPTGLSCAKPLAWQHTCPHSWVIVFRWNGGDPQHPPDLITVEHVVDRF